MAGVVSGRAHSACLWKPRSPHASGTVRGPRICFWFRRRRSGPRDRMDGSAASRKYPVRGPVSWNGAVLQFSGTTMPPSEFSGLSQEVANLWQVRLPERSGHVEGEPRRITFGAASEHDSALLPNGGTVYSSEHYTLTPIEVSLDESALPSTPRGRRFLLLDRISCRASPATALLSSPYRIDPEPSISG